MEATMIDFTLTESQLELLRVAREFVRREIRPVKEPYPD